jgi:DNA-binding protein HU-beta
MAKRPMSKSGLVNELTERHSETLKRKDIKAVLESIAEIGQAELKKKGIFAVPGLVRMAVVKKAATKARKGINPFTKEPTVFKAKPARKVIKARAVKAAKDAVA